MSANVDSNVMVGICPGCRTRIRFHKRMSLGEFVSCDECGDELEVVQLQPLKLDWAYADPLDDDDAEFDESFLVEDDDYYDWDYD